MRGIFKIKFATDKTQNIVGKRESSNHKVVLRIHKKKVVGNKLTK